MTLPRHLIAAVLAAVPTAVPAADPAWPQFRGPAAAGVADAVDLPTDLGPNKHVRWKVPAPAGFSSPVAAGDALYLTGFENGKLYTLAYARRDGKELWRAEAPARAIEPYHKTQGSPAASTPATDGRHVVAYFGSCGLFCYTTAGKEVWRHEMPAADTAFGFGSGVSPVIADGVVYLLRDLKADSKLLAYDVATGKLVWEKKRPGFGTSWGTPTVWRTPAGPELVVPGSLRLTSYDPKTGDVKWFVGGLAANSCTTPVPAPDGTLVYAAWSPGGADFKMPTYDDLLGKHDKNGDKVLDKAELAGTPFADFFDNNDANRDGKLDREEWEAPLRFLASGKNQAVAVKPGGSGDVTAKNVAWRATKGLPYVPTPLVYRGRVYTVNMRGDVSAFDLATGKEVYLEEGVGLTGAYASPVAAGGHVYLFGLDGTLVVLKAGDDPDVVARAKFGERVAATPCVVDNTMYVRTAGHLYAFGK